MVRRKSRLGRNSKVRKQHLRKEKPILERVKEFKEGIQKTLKVMETKKTYAIYQIPTIFLHPKVYGGYRKIVKDMRKLFPDMDFKIKILSKGKVSTDIKVSNVTPNEAIELASYFIIRGGSIKVFQ